MLLSISLTNFKSYKDATLPLAPLSLLIGANASGKSNAIEGIRFLSWLAEGRRLDDLMSAVQSEDQRLRGTVKNLAYDGAATFGFRCSTDIDYGAIFSIDIEITDEGMKVVSESISSPQSSVPLYNVAKAGHKFSHELQVQYNNFASGGKKPRIPCSDQQAVFTQLETPARFAGGHGKAQKVIPRGRRVS